MKRNYKLARIALATLGLASATIVTAEPKVLALGQQCRMTAVATGVY